MTNVRVGIKGQPVEGIAAAHEGREFLVAEISQQLTRRRLGRGYASIWPLLGEPASDDV